MTTINLVQNGGTWPWSSTVTSVSYRSGSTTAGWQEYLLWDDTSNSNISSGGIHAIQKDANNDWKDKGTSAPVHMAISSSVTEPAGGGMAQPVTASSTNKYLHMWTGASPPFYMGYMDVWTPFNSGSSGPTVTDGRTSHSGIIPNAVDFTIRDPNPSLWYEKTGNEKFKITFYDQNEPVGGYSVTIDWTGSNNNAQQLTHQVSSASQDLYIELDCNGNVGIKHNSTISVSFNYAVKYNGVLYQNTAVKTFTYLATGPFTASFTPSSGTFGGWIAVNVKDTNPYPDNDTTYSYKTSSGTIVNAPMNQANNYEWNEPNAFQSTIGNAYIYDIERFSQASGNVVATGTWTEQIESDGGPRRYPIIMTNLFDRQRSDYAIGKTHKDLNTGNLF